VQNVLLREMVWQGLRGSRTGAMGASSLYSSAQSLRARRSVCPGPPRVLFTHVQELLP
jgi:hypothetical protein